MGFFIFLIQVDNGDKTILYDTYKKVTGNAQKEELYDKFEFIS